MQAAAQDSFWPAVIRQDCEGRLFGQTCAKMNVLDRARAISAVQPFPPGAVTDDVAELNLCRLPSWKAEASWRIAWPQPATLRRYALLLEQAQDVLGIRVGDRQRLDAELLLRLQGL